MRSSFKRIARLVVPCFVLCLAPALNAGLISHFPFDGNVEDVVSDNDGIFVGTGDGAGAPVFGEGFDGTPNGAVVFNGTGDYVQVPHNTGLPITDQPAFTITMWVNGAIQSDRRVFSEGSSSSNTPLFNIGTPNAGGGNGEVNSFLRPGPGHRRSTGIAFDETWHHIAWVDDGGRVAVYIDGVQDATNLSYSRELAGLDRTSIGAILRGGPAAYFAGSIDDVKLFDHALTRAEVEALVPSVGGCIGDNDTHCTGLAVGGPPGNVPGRYTFTASATDDSDDPIVGYVTVTDPDGNIVVDTPPAPLSALDLRLDVGSWTVSVLVRDDVNCGSDAADAVCEANVEVVAAPEVLVAHFPFDGDTLDQSGFGNDGVFVGEAAPAFDEGWDGTPSGAIVFDGTGFVDVDQAAILPIYDSGVFSVTAWVKGPISTADVRDRRYFSEGTSSGNNNTLFNLGTANVADSGAFDLFIRSDSGAQQAPHFKSARDAFDDTWHHIAYVDDNGSVVVYIDGVRDATEFSYTRSTLSNLNTTTIGGILRGGPCCLFQGAIDEVRVYNYALTQEEVNDLVPEPDDCPGDADTHCDGLVIVGPEDETAGEYTLTASATDDTGNDVLYTFLATSDSGARIQVGPAPENEAIVTLAAGIWDISVTVDDSIRCRDVAEDNGCSDQIEVLAEPKLTLAHLPLDGDLLDVSGNANDGVWSLESDVPFTEGIDCDPTSAVAFDGVAADRVGGLIKVTPTDGLPLTSRTVFSIAMWVNGPPNQRDKRVFSEASSDPAQRGPLFNIGTAHDASDGTVDLFVRGNSTPLSHVHSTTEAFDNTWHHIVWVDDNGQAVLYIDGVADATEFTYTRPGFAVPLDNTTIGGIMRGANVDDVAVSDVCCVFEGSIDDVRFFNYALTPADIATIIGDGPQNCCPEEGDTICDGLAVTGPGGGNGPGIYSAEAAAFDASGDDIIYTFTADNGEDAPIVVGPQASNVAEFDLGSGSWSVSVVVDDDPDCDDASPDATCQTVLEVCPGEGDTHCKGLTVSLGEADGEVLAEANGSDDSFDDVSYTFTVTPAGGGEVVATVGPQAENTAVFTLEPGDYDVTVTVDDDPDCADEADDASCSSPISVPEPGIGPFRRGDCNGDGGFEGSVSDMIAMLDYAFVGALGEPPCLAACDFNADGAVAGGPTDAIAMARYLFLGELTAAEITPPFGSGDKPVFGRSSLETDISLGCETPRE